MLLAQPRRRLKMQNALRLLRPLGAMLLTHAAKLGLRLGYLATQTLHLPRVLPLLHRPAHTAAQRHAQRHSPQRAHARKKG